MNDVILNWKKIKRMLPTIRRYALDRVPTLEELREILDAADVRGKALTLVLVSSGLREGAVPSLRISNYSKIKAPLCDTGGSSMNSGNNGPINRGGHQLLAGKLVIYHGEPESYSAFISPEACIALDKYLDFRREHGEQITESSPLFRDKFDPVQALHNDKPSNNNSASNSDEHSFLSARTIKNETMIYGRRKYDHPEVMPITEHSIRQFP
jgi:integrase